MRIYTLGSGHGDSSFSRFNSSTVYETDGVLYMVDAGAPCEALLRRKGLLIKDLRATFVTHMHDDHAGGLSGLIKQISKYGKNREMDFSLFLPEKTAIEPLKNWVFALHENADFEKIEYKEVNDGLVFEDENLAVSAIRTAHLRTKGRTEGDPCSFAYVLYFKKENKKVLHTGDLMWNFSDFPKIAMEEEFDICLCEATHYDPNTALALLENSKFKRLLFIHVSDKWHVRIYPGWEVDNGEKRLIDICKTVPYPVEIARDGNEYYI